MASDPVDPPEPDAGRTPFRPQPAGGGDVGPGLEFSVGEGRTGADLGAAGDSDARAEGLAPGTVLAERYEVRALLGAGGMGAVYRVFDRLRAVEIALKVMRPSILERPKAAERFRQEAEALLRLSHPGIVHVFDVNFDSSRKLAFYTMELLEGESLREHLRAKKEKRALVAPAFALEVTRQLLEALAYAHRTTVHRDLKPENVFLSRDPLGAPDSPPQVKILDFGLAKLRSAAELTSTSVALGTAYYMAPEQHGEAARVDARADLFAVCVILFEMLTGAVPAGAVETPSAERKARLEKWARESGAGAPLPQDAARLPAGIDAIVMAGLKRDPADRPGSAEALLAEVQRVRGLLKRRPARRRAALNAAAALLAVAAAALGLLRPWEGGAPTVRLFDLEPADHFVTKEKALLVKGRVEGSGVAAVYVNRVAADLSGGRFEVRIPVSPEIAIEARGPGGSVLAAESRRVVIDRTAPVIRLEGGTERVTREAKIEISGSVEDENPEPRLSLDDTAIALDGGRFKAELPLEGAETRFTLKARDRAGNEAVALLRAVRKTSPPAVRLEAPADGLATSKASVEVRGRVDDPYPGYAVVRGARVELEKDGSFGTSVALAEGTNEIEVRAVDRAGNRSEAARVRVEHDTSRPVPQLDGPLPDETEEETLAVAGSVSEPGCAVSVGGKPARVDGRRFTATVPLAEGENRIEIVATDRAGNQGSILHCVRCLFSSGWFREPMPRGMRKARERPVYVWDTGKGLEIEMVYVPPGDFIMGSDGGEPDEHPKHTHPMPKGYYIGRCETTWREYRVFCRASGRSEPKAPSWAANDDHPVVNVSWEDAKAFCEWAGLRLPTEAEWEKAARGTDGREFPWGNAEATADLAVFQGFGMKPVGSCPNGASPYGALDLAGNVSEWCADWYDSSAYARYARGDATPPADGSRRVIRGGAWSDGLGALRAACRRRLDPDDRFYPLGFRPARGTPE